MEAAADMSENLTELRDAIDVIDGEILQALAQRMRLSDKVIAAKGGVAAFRPGREAQLIRQLVAHGGSQGLSPTVILAIWRQIMAASLGRQNGQQACAVHPGAVSAAVWHMGSTLEVLSDHHLGGLVAMLADGTCRYALVPALGSQLALAETLACHPGVYIIARTPLYDIPSIPPAFILANHLPDPSGDDISVLLTTTDTGQLQLRTVDGYCSEPEDTPADTRLVGVYAR